MSMDVSDTSWHGTLTICQPSKQKKKTMLIIQRKTLCKCVHVRTLCVCMHACVRACVCVHACVSVCVRERDSEWMKERQIETEVSAVCVFHMGDQASPRTHDSKSSLGTLVEGKSLHHLNWNLKTNKSTKLLTRRIKKREVNQLTKVRACKQWFHGQYPVASQHR